MTAPYPLIARLEALGWSQRYLAARLGLPETRIRPWASGKEEAPHQVRAWLNRLMSFHVEHPLPDGWAQSELIARRREASAKQMQRLRVVDELS